MEALDNLGHKPPAAKSPPRPRHGSIGELGLACPAMTDFGANIFDESAEPSPARSKPRPPEPPLADAAPAVAPSPRPRRGRGGRERVEAERAEFVPPTPVAEPMPEPMPAPMPAPLAPAGVEAERQEQADRLPRPPRSERPERQERPQRHERFPRPQREPRPEPRRPAEPSDELPPTAAAVAPRPQPRTEAPRRPAARPANRAVAVLVDLDALHAEARAQRGELAMHRLLPALVGQRAVASAVAFTVGGSTPPRGFDLRPNGRDPSFAARFAAVAHELADRHGRLLMAPASPAVQQLAASLRAAGHEVELAAFRVDGPGDTDWRRLGRECLFVP
jgi:hypothetical protein